MKPPALTRPTMTLGHMRELGMVLLIALFAETKRVS
jgi:hypothetical protein